eukprot:scaffold28499_cov65-Phaeocystis_antarctica.AAC.7
MLLLAEPRARPLTPLCSNALLPQQRAPVQLELLDDGVPGDLTRSTRVTGARPPSRAGKGRGRHREQAR